MIDVAVLTVSDSGAAGLRADLSGPAIVARCAELGWQVVQQALLPDEEPRIARQLQDWADTGNALLILTTGGTGVSKRDHTPEATRPLLERELPGVSELLRREGRAQTPFAVLSRGVAGTRKQSLIVNLPGSPKGALHSLGLLEPLVPHILALLRGDTEH